MTYAQKRLYDYLVAYWRENGQCPSYRQAAKDLGFSGWSSIHGQMQALIAQGWAVDGTWGPIPVFKIRLIEGRA